MVDTVINILINVCQEDPVSLPSGRLEKTTRSSPHHVAQHHPTRSETTTPYAPRSSRFGSEPPSVEDDVNVWRYAILELHARNNDDDVCYRNFQYVCGVHVVRNKIKWSTFLCATHSFYGFFLWYHHHSLKSFTHCCYYASGYHLLLLLFYLLLLLLLLLLFINLLHVLWITESSLLNTKRFESLSNAPSTSALVCI